MLDSSGLRRAYAAAALVTEVAVLTGVGLWLGSLADGRFGVEPWGVLFGTFIGFGAGLTRLFVAIQRLDPPNDDPRDDPS
jgi:F0F1-type ATP synthase assembly protein I